MVQATRNLRQRLTPWAGLWLGAGAWALHHEIGVYTDYASCRASGPVPVLLTTLVAAAVAVTGGLISWRARRAARETRAPDQSVRGFLGELSAMAAAVFLFAILLQTLAGLIVPECWK